MNSIGSFHLSKIVNSKRKLNKNKINDIKKKEIICSENKLRLIRIWSEIGLYSRFETFNKILNMLKSNLNSLTLNPVCVDIIVDKDLNIYENREYFI